MLTVPGREAGPPELRDGLLRDARLLEDLVLVGTRALLGSSLGLLASKLGGVGLGLQRKAGRQGTGSCLALAVPWLAACVIDAV